MKNIRMQFMKSREAMIICSLSAALTACGGGASSNGPQTTAAPISVGVSGKNFNEIDLSEGISSAALKPDYGQPQSAEKIAAMAKILGGYFRGAAAPGEQSDTADAKSSPVLKSVPNPQAVYRFFNTRTGVHFYTMSSSEKDHVLSSFPWFNFDGPAFFALQGTAASLSPVYRFYNTVSGTHFYTISESEKDDVLARFSSIFQLEGVSWYASTTGGDGWTPIYRFFNTQTGTHFYTASEEEYLSVQANLKQYIYEGIGYYVRNSADPFLSGKVVVNGAVRNAVVCLDLNANDACDDGEPVAPKTGVDGIYRLTVHRSLVSESAQNAASLISPMVPGSVDSSNTTVDQATGGQPTTNYLFAMKQVPGKAGQINPLSTLVTAGVSNGMTETEARQNAALQLAFNESKIDNYQDDPALNVGAPQDNARLMALVVASALESGAPLEVGRQTDSVVAAPLELRTLRFTDLNNYSYLEYFALPKAAGVPGASLSDLRQGKIAGALIDEASLYNQAYLTGSGWQRCTSSVPVTTTRGTPNRGLFCGALQTAGYRNNISIAGQTMADVVSALQGTSSNTINQGQSTTELLGALGNVSFPSGSALRPGFSLNLNQPVFLNSIDTDGRVEGVNATLENFMADHGAASTDLALPAVGSSLSLGLGSGDFRNLRVAFISASSPTAGSVQFYECDLDATQTIASNCAKTQIGSYAINTIGGDRVMSFAGHAATVATQERLYVEVSAANQINAVIGGGNWIFQARRQKPGWGYNSVRNTRLNGVAWTAMKGQLGI